MATTPKLVRSLSTRTIKKLEKPKPIKINPLHTSASYSLDDLVNMIESASHCISKKNYNDLVGITSTLTPKLRMYGQRIEEAYKDQLDKAFVNFRNGCREDEIDYNTRLNLLHLVELRAMAWHSCASTNQYYLYKGSAVEEPNDGNISPQLVGNQPLLLNPGEVIKSSGKFSSPTKMPGKNYCKDEVVIRNADSGKVSPGAKERLVQITGPDGDKIEFARQLIEDTIKRNASPVRELEKDTTGSTSSLNSSASEDSTRFLAPGNQEWKYTHTVHHQGRTLIMASADLEFLMEAKLKLEKCLVQGSDLKGHHGRAKSPPEESMESSISSIVNSISTSSDPPKVAAPAQKASTPPKVVKSVDKERESPNLKMIPQKEPIVSQESSSAVAESPKHAALRSYRYNRDFLLECSATGPSLQKPVDYQKILQEFPAIIRTSSLVSQVSLGFDAAAYLRKWMDVQVVTVAYPLGDLDSD
uniref:MIF4G domain-containing protein A n=2 Tax=Lygus hesperus TaxID=30085 RepID=A0A146KQ72_LYGHE